MFSLKQSCLISPEPFHINVYHTSIIISCQIKSGILKYNYQPEKHIGYGENSYVKIKFMVLKKSLLHKWKYIYIQGVTDFNTLFLTTCSYIDSTPYVKIFVGTKCLVKEIYQFLFFWFFFLLAVKILFIDRSQWKLVSRWWIIISSNKSRKIMKNNLLNSFYLQSKFIAKKVFLYSFNLKKSSSERKKMKISFKICNNIWIIDFNDCTSRGQKE